MIKTRGRKIIADVLSRKGRTLMVSMSIMMGVFGVVVLVGMGDLLVRQITADNPPESIAMNKLLVVLPQGSLSREENLAILDEIAAKVPGITAAEGLARSKVKWRLSEDGEQAGQGEDALYSSGNLFAFLLPFGAGQLEPVTRVFEGRYPEAGSNEIAVEVRFAEARGVALGDQIVFQTLSEDAPAQPWTVVGLVYHPYFVTNTNVIEYIMPQDNLYAAYEDAQRIAGITGMTTIFTRASDFQTSLAISDHLVDYVANETPFIPVFNFPEDPDDTLLYGQISEVAAILTSLAFVAMLVSGFLVINVINTLIVEQQRQIGVLKSLGASRADTMFIYAGISLVYGLIGTTLGLLLGIPATSALTARVAEQSFTYIDGFVVSPTSVIAGLVLGLLVPVLVSIIPVYNGTRITILEAMTDLGISSSWGRSRLSRLIGALPLPITMRQALSNVMQKKGRLALTGFTLLLAVAAYMGVSAAFVSLRGEVDTFFTADYEILAKFQGVQDFEQMREIISAVDGVTGVFAGFDITVQLEGYVGPPTDVLFAGTDGALAVGVDPLNEMIGFEFIAGGGWQADEDGVVLSRALARDFNKSVGDSVVVDLGGQTRVLEVLGIHNFSFAGVYMRWDTLAQMAGFVDASGAPMPNSYYINLDGTDLSIDEVDAAINRIERVMGAAGVLAQFTNQPLAAYNQAQQVEVFGLVFNVTSFVMAGVGAIGLLATLSMAVFERQKEIGVMRSIGAGAGTIVAQFMTEGVLIGLIAWLIAVPLSYGLGSGLLQSMPFPDLVYLYPASILLNGLVGIILVTIVASMWPSLMAARRTVSDILRYQ